MNEEKLIETLEGLDIPSDKIDEIMVFIKDQKEHSLEEGDKIGDTQIRILEEELKNETDWRKRSSLAAKIISYNLE